MSRHELIAQIAYLIYCQRGCAPGRHSEDWFAAEAIVRLCEAFLGAEIERLPQQEGAAPADPLTLLEQAVAARGRKAVAGELGYRSASTVGRYLRGDRQIGEELAARILEAFGATPTRQRRAA